VAGEAPDSSFESRPGNQEKAAHRIGEIGRDDDPGEEARNSADGDPATIPLTDATACGMAAADDYVEVLRLDGAEHLR